MPVPFQTFRRNAAFAPQPLDQLWHAARQRCARKRYAESHGVTHSNLDRNTALLAQAHERRHERNDKAVKISPRRILQMATDANTSIERRLYDLQIIF